MTSYRANLVVDFFGVRRFRERGVLELMYWKNSLVGTDISLRESICNCLCNAWLLSYMKHSNTFTLSIINVARLLILITGNRRLVRCKRFILSSFVLVVVSFVIVLSLLIILSLLVLVLISCRSLAIFSSLLVVLAFALFLGSFVL